MFHPRARSLASMDPEVHALVGRELARQEDGIEMIASENYASPAVMEAQGSALTNKYAEGLPGRRYYGGCGVVDAVEGLAIDRARALFGAAHANVQPHSGSQANMAAYLALMEPGETLLGMDLSQGGHLTHGSPVNFSGRLFRAASYGVDPSTGRIDLDRVRDAALRERPAVIVAGASAYPRAIDFGGFGDVAREAGARLLADMAHIAGLVAAGVHPSPVPHAHAVTTTTHKTLRGPRGGLVLCRDKDVAKKVDFHVFPGTQGGPLPHVVAAKAVALGEAADPGFRAYQERTLACARALADALSEGGADLVTGGTDNHLVLARTDPFGLSGKEAEEALEGAGVACNKNMVPGDARPPSQASGIRLGTPACATRGMGPGEMRTVAGWILRVLRAPRDQALRERVRGEALELCRAFPVYPPAGAAGP